MIVNWSKSAQSHWFEAASYIKMEFGIKALDNFAKATDDVVRQLFSCPHVDHLNRFYHTEMATIGVLYMESIPN